GAGRGTSASDPARVRSLLQYCANAPVIGPGCSGLSPDSADRTDRVARPGWRAASPIRLDLGFGTHRYGVGAPKATPAEIIDQLNKEISAGLADPNMKARFADLGGTVLAGSAADFGKLIADETEKWAKVVKFVGIKAD